MKHQLPIEITAPAGKYGLVARLKARVLNWIFSPYIRLHIPKKAKQVTKYTLIKATVTETHVGTPDNSTINDKSIYNEPNELNKTFGHHKRPRDIKRDGQFKWKQKQGTHS